MAVFVLQTLAVERGATRRAAQQKAARLHVARRPRQVADALETKHRIKNEKRNHVLAMVGVAGARRHPRAKCARLIDAFLQNLSGLVFLVEHQFAGINRLIKLPDRGVNAQLAKQAFHAEGARFIGHNRHQPGAQFLVADERGEGAHKRHGGGDFALFGGFQQRIENGQIRHLERWNIREPYRQRATEFFARGFQVLHLRRIVGRLVKRHIGNDIITHRNIETVAELFERTQIHLFLLMGDVLPFTRLAHAVAFDGFGEDDGRLPLVFHRRGIRRINFVRVVATTIEAPDILVRHRRHHFFEFGIFAEKGLAHIGAVTRLVILIFAVHRFHHAGFEQPVVVPGQQRIPISPPDHFQYIPAGAAKITFQFLDDLAVAAHRAIEPLQIAIDHKNQIVETLAGGQRNRAERFRLVHLAVPHECPYLAALGVDDAAVVQVFHEARLVNRLQRAEAHRHGGELPEVRHQPRVRVGRNALAVNLAAEIHHLLFADAALEKGAGVHTRCRVALHENQVAAMGLGGGVPEVVEAHVIKGCCRLKTGDVATQFG